MWDGTELRSKRNTLSKRVDVLCPSPPATHCSLLVLSSAPWNRPESHTPRSTYARRKRGWDFPDPGAVHNGNAGDLTNPPHSPLRSALHQLLRGTGGSLHPKASAAGDAVVLVEMGACYFLLQGSSVSPEGRSRRYLCPCTMASPALAVPLTASPSSSSSAGPCVPFLKADFLLPQRPLPPE